MFLSLLRRVIGVWKSKVGSGKIIEKKKTWWFSKKALLTLHVTTETHFLLQKNLKNIMHGLVKMYLMHWPFCWTTFLFDSAPSCIDKKLGFIWAPIVLPWLQIYSCFVMKWTLWCLFLMIFLIISRLILLMLLTLHRYLDDTLNIYNVYFDTMVSQIYPSELQLNKANTSDMKTTF